MFAAQLLGVAANWIIQFVIDVANCLKSAFERRKEKNNRRLQIEPEDLRKLAVRTAANSLRAGASLTFAAVGAGLGTVLVRPNSGTWIGKLPQAMFSVGCVLLYGGPGAGLTSFDSVSCRDHGG